MPDASRSSPANLLVLMTDQHRLDTLGCYGNQVCQTPALDALADGGVRFDAGFTPTAICTPARATLLTGVLPFRHTLLANYERTAVVFTADHGEFTGSHRQHDKGPAMYDDIYRVPLIIRASGGHVGATERRFATLTDLTPTFLDLAGVPVPEHFDGRSLLPLLRGDSADDWPRELIAEFHGHHFPYPQGMIRTDRYKLVINPADRSELYDLAADPDELHNRYHHPELRAVREDLTRRLYDTLRDRGDNFYHWMTSMFEVGAKSYETALSQLDPAVEGRS